MSSEQKAAILSRLYPKKDIDINGLTVEMKALPFGKVPSAFTLMTEMLNSMSAGVLIDEGRAAKFKAYIAQSITVPECPEITYDDLPVFAHWDLMEAFVDLNFPQGKCGALIQKLQKEFTVPAPTLNQG